jgi:ABC-type Fe3+/spermidine/putrescine transport system ATPase subunit
VIRDGHIVQVGIGSELYFRPKEDLTARFLREAVLPPAQLACGWAECILARIAVDDVAYEGHARITSRPEQVQINAADSGNSDGARWRVEQVDFEGFSSLITTRAIGATLADGPRSLTVRGLSTQPLERGTKSNSPWSGPLTGCLSEHRREQPAARPAVVGHGVVAVNQSRTKSRIVSLAVS